MRTAFLPLLISACLFGADSPFAGNEKVFELAKTFKGRGVQAC